MNVNFKKSDGFTLIELMIAVAIVGILAAVAYPSYTSMLQQSRRIDGIAPLLNIQMAQEKWRANNPAYTADYEELLGIAGGGNTQTSEDGFYQVTLEAADATTWSATATPLGTQADDSCGMLSINQNGPVQADDAARSCWNQ